MTATTQATPLCDLSLIATLPNDQSIITRIANALGLTVENVSADSIAQRVRVNSGSNELCFTETADQLIVAPIFDEAQPQKIATSSVKGVVSFLVDREVAVLNELALDWTVKMDFGRTPEISSEVKQALDIWFDVPNATLQRVAAELT